MGEFSKKEVLRADVSMLPFVAEHIKDEFEGDGYEVAMEILPAGGYDISITKGGIFKAVLGMKTAMKVTLIPKSDSIDFEASIGIWKQQIIPTILSMLFFWPILVTQIWSLIRQAGLDDRALAVATKALNETIGSEEKLVIKDDYISSDVETEKPHACFCPGCGEEIKGDIDACPSCGELLKS